MSQSVPIWMMVLGFLLVLGPLITLHELGHYLVGRMFGVKADAFSIGFGRELAGFTDRRGTRWKLSALPLGGYVQFAGDMNPASQPTDEWLSLPREEREMTFQAKPLWQRALIVAAGPVTNFVIALGIFAFFFAIYGMQSAAPVISKFADESTARSAGLQVGDRITAMNGAAVTDFLEVRDYVMLRPDEQVTLSYLRDGQEGRVAVPIASSVISDEFGNEGRIGLVGIYSEQMEWREVGAGEAALLAWDHCAGLIDRMATGLGQILSGKRSVDELGGPLRIAKVSGERLSQGPLFFVEFAALISINLAFINLLPIPALDGGHLAFYAVEAVRRKPVGARGQEWAFRTGIGLVLALMLFVTINDIASLVF